MESVWGKWKDQEQNFNQELYKELRIPTTVETMGNLLKIVCDDYIKGNSTTIEFEGKLKYLFYKREDLYWSALTDRWVGKKRKRLIESLMA